MSAENQLTPMMTQYRRIKGGLPADALLLFRLGDFYELFFEDAQKASQILNLALTRRNGVPMCGVPYHAAGGYIGKLLKSGYKVAICDQVEEPKPGKLVRREVTQIISPGTHFDERMLQAERNNYLASVVKAGKTFGLAYLDLTTGAFKCTEIEEASALLAELERLRPAEVIIPDDNLELAEFLQTGKFPQVSENNTSAPSSVATSFGWILNGYDGWVFLPETAVHTILEHFKVATLDGFGLRDRGAAICAAGAAIHYLTQHLRREIKNLSALGFYSRSDYLVLDSTTLRHLEVLETIQPDAPQKATLYGALNRTVTPMGARLLRDWLTQPLASVEAIVRRQEAVQTLLDNSELRQSLRQALAEVRDLERTIGRLSAGAGNARDMIALKQGLEKLPIIRACLSRLISSSSADSAVRELPLPFEHTLKEDHQKCYLEELLEQIEELPHLVELISKAIVEDPPLTIKEGGIIRDGFDPVLDELRCAMREGKEWIAKLQQEEIQKTGISSLKIRFNSVFGYYIEVTKANLDKVPDYYIRKQTIAGGERFITAELKAMEEKILGAEERSVKLEYDIFQRVREQVVSEIKRIQRVASALSQLDVLGCFAEVAHYHNYCRPEIGNEGLIEIEEGRHPVLEQTMMGERFVPNDTKLGGDVQIAIITGPNMAGKSTYIRQVALLVLLAHTGSFIPAKRARIDLVDRIFTRIGASDDIARGQSTFMVEMSETANILNNATPNSLVILDEIGRGTSTFDGLSLAWSIVEYIHNVVGAKTLFATHYHELTELAAKYKRIRNYNIAVREWRDQVIFLRKIVEGACDKSYGIQVARIAGIPPSVIERAKQILANLEESELTPDGNVRYKSRRNIEREKLRNLAPEQLDLFGV